MKSGISTNISTQKKAACLAGEGVPFVIRYYSKPGSSKAIKQSEADALAAAGIMIGVVYQENARSIREFTKTKAQTHAANAWNSAQSVRQPAGSVIYFAVDYDASLAELRGDILSYFNEVHATLAHLAGGTNPYHLGVYGSGRSCKLLKDNCPAVRYTWLSVSKGWADSRTYNDWDLNQTWGDGEVCGLTPVYISGGNLHDGDYEYNADDGDFGGFFPGISVARANVASLEAAEAVQGLEFKMELGSGLALRTGTLTVFGAKHTVLLEALVTSGRPGHQGEGSQWESGLGPIPASNEYVLETDSFLPESNAHLGVRFQIAPQTVRNSTGTSRSGFSIHALESQAGSSGGITMLHDNDFTELRRLLAPGGASRPLKVIYTGGVMNLSPAALKKLGAVFSMKLRDQSKMIYGTFEITGSAGEKLYSGVATSGLAGHQHPGSFWEVGRGVVPPTSDDRYIITEVYATDSPMGKRYQITPEKVSNADHTRSRSAFRVHFDGGVPGSAGCIVTPSHDDYDKIVQVMATLNSRGISKIPLTLNYT